MKRLEYIIVAAILAVVIAVPIAFAAINHYQKVSIIVNEPKGYAIGELVTLDASASKADELIWRIIPANDNFVVDGKVAHFSSTRAIDYTVIIVARRNNNLDCKVFTLPFPFGKKEKEKEKEKEKVILTPFELEVKSWLPEDTTGVQQLAQSFKIVARIIDVFDNVDGVILATAKANTLALGDSLENWKPFLQKFQDYLEANPPATIKDHGKVWNNLATALEKLSC